LALAALAGCHASKAESGGAVLSPSAADLAPETSPGEKAILRLGASAATEFEVGLETRKEGASLEIDLTANGESLEREAYESTGSEFRVVTAGVDSFAPGIDLLRYPVREGGSWRWDGKVAYAGASRPAHGQVSVRKEGAEIRSEVRLFVSVDPGRPEIERRMTFWFHKERGVVRRAFGDVSSRRPVEDAWRR